MATENINIKIDVQAQSGLKSMREMRQEMRELQLAMEAAAKAGDATKFKQLEKAVADVRKELKETNACMKMLDPGEILAGFVKMGQGAVGAFSAVTGAMALFGTESEKIQEIQQRSMALIQTMMGLEKARQLLIDGGARAEMKALFATTAQQYKKIAAYVTEALTIKTVEGASKSATAAQKVWNKAVAANPILLLVAAVAALTAGVYALVKAFKAQNDEMKKMSEEEQKLARLRKANFEVNNKVAKSYASIEVSLRTYQKIVNDTNKTDEERFAALKEIEKATNGVVTATDLSSSSLTSLNDQLDRYIENSFDVAMAQAAIELATAEFTKILEAQRDMEQFKPDWWQRLGNNISAYFHKLIKSSDPFVTGTVLNTKQMVKSQQEAIDKAEEMMETYKEIAAEYMTAAFEKAKVDWEALEELRKQQAALEAAKRRYQDYVGAIKKANEEAKLQVALGENATEVRVRELEAIYSATKAYYELNGYTADEIEKLKELRAEIEELNTEIADASKSSKREAAAVKAIETEMELEIELLKLREDDSKVWDELKAKELKQAEYFRTKELEQLEKQYENKEILEKDYLIEKENINKKYQIKKTEIETEYTDKKTNRELEQANWKNETELLMLENMIRESVTLEERKQNEIKKLDYEYEQEKLALEELRLLDKEEYNKRLIALDKKYALDKQEIETNINKEIYQSQADLMTKLAELKAENAETENEYVAAQLEILRLREEEELARYKDNEEIKTEIKKKYAKERERLEIESAQRVLQNTQDIMDAMSGIVTNLMEMEIEETAKSEEDKKKIRKKYAGVQTMVSVAQIAVNTGQAIMKAVADLGPVAGAISAAALGALGVSQIGLAMEQYNSIQRMKRGGLITGPSHERGGVQLELEGGEAVLNKNAMRIPAYRAIASSMNESTGGVPFTNVNPMSSGGQLLFTSVIDDKSLTKIVTEVTNKIVQIPVNVTETDISNTQRKVQLIKARTSF